MKPYFCLIASLFLTSCVVIPVPVERVVLEGKRFTNAELDFVRLGTTTRREVIDNLGNPTLWLSAQRILVYGLRQVETGALWFIGAGLSGAGGLVEGETKEAVFLVLDDKDVVTHWGRAQVKRGATWLSAATEWAGSKAIEIPPARGRFVEETPTREQSLIYFYRPRDFQHFLPLVPPAKKIPPGTANYADIRQDGKLVGQIRWQSYVAVRVPPGAYSFVVNADTDYVVNPESYRSVTIRLDVAPETVTFVDVGIQAGLGTIEPILVDRPRSEAIPVIEKLRESW
ncbi:MAG: hypothetical protein OEQ39_18280 [Gammaproteobacteria bacterium]|nr:hypothetical protein [Gammaproteobacteria bacterium]